MRSLRLLIIALAVIFLLAFVASALINRPAAPSDDVIIIKGGSLTIQCPGESDCLTASGKGKYEHKDNKDPKSKKVQLIVVKDEDGNVLGSFSKANFPNGKPSIEITYK
jgi:hypothetical protein